MDSHWEFQGSGCLHRVRHFARDLGTAVFGDCREYLGMKERDLFQEVELRFRNKLDIIINWTLGSEGSWKVKFKDWPLLGNGLFYLQGFGVEAQVGNSAQCAGAHPWLQLS